MAKLSEETKKKISEKRRKYLEKNRDQHNWSKFNPRGENKPERNFRERLEVLGVSAYQYYIPPESKRFFEMDFAIPELKIAFEINGNQHYDGYGKLAPYYQSRHDYLTSIGWSVNEIHYSECFKSDRIDAIVSECLNGLGYSSEPQLVNHRVERKRERELRLEKEKLERAQTKELEKQARQVAKQEFEKLLAEERANKAEINKERMSKLHLLSVAVVKGIAKPETWKVERPTREELQKLVWEQSTVALGKKFGVSDKAVEKWCKFYGIEKPPRGHWAKQTSNQIIATKPCSFCGNDFTAKQHSKYCSSTCMEKAHWQRRKLRNAK